MVLRFNKRTPIVCLPCASIVIPFTVEKTSYLYIGAFHMIRDNTVGLISNLVCEMKSGVNRVMDGYRLGLLVEILTDIKCNCKYGIQPVRRDLRLW